MNTTPTTHRHSRPAVAARIATAQWPPLGPFQPTELVPPFMVVTLLVTLLLVAASTPAAAQITNSRKHPVLILQEGDRIPGSVPLPVTVLSGPVEAGGDSVGIAAVLGSGDEGALWVANHSGRETTPVLASDVGARLFYPNRFGIRAEPVWGGGEPSSRPFFAKARLIRGDLAVVTPTGVVQRFGAWAPGLTGKATITDVKRIQMLYTGETYWQADWQSPTGGGEALYRSAPGWTQPTEPLMRTGDPLCGGVVSRMGHFRIAANQTHGHIVDIADDRGDRTALVVDRSCRFSEGEPLKGTNESPFWFWHFDVNSAGHVLFGAETDGPSHNNGVIALDGVVVMREGDTIDGVRLRSMAIPNEIRLDDRGRAVTLWAFSSADYTIFYTPDITRFDDTRALVSENTPLDLDGDGAADAQLHEFRFFDCSGPTFSLADTGIYIAVLLRYPGSSDLVPAVIFYPF